MLLLIESLLVVAAIVLAFCCPRLGESWFAPLERGLSRLARRRLLSVVIVGLTALILRVMLLPILPIPEPAVHDEFSYLLAADTFAHGRLANPTHPMWVHFETFHVNQKPTYVSMYYPAQGLFMAAGQVIFGHPFWGVWLSTGLMCAAICWMLQGWLPPFWALLGGLLAVIRLGTFSYWMNSYWGGSVAALGGALVLGALPRIKRKPSVRDAVLMGVGFALLANSRPYEGLFLSIPVIAILAFWMRKPTSPGLRVVFPRIVIPLLLVCALTLSGMGYYFWRTTGNPLRTPYQINMQTYGVAIFPWQKIAPIPEYHHAVMRDYYSGEHIAGQYNNARLHPVIWLWFKAVIFWAFFLGFVFMLPIAGLAAVLPYGMSFSDVSYKTRFLFAVCGITALALALPVSLPEAHYAAPITSAIYALVLLAMQRLRLWNRKTRHTGLFLVRSVPVICVLLLLIRVASPALHIPIHQPIPHTWCECNSPATDRSLAAAELDKYPGPQLAIVRYLPGHASANEWVYNNADIDKSKVVWARDMGPDGNAELIRYFQDRRVWLVEPDKAPPKLSPYNHEPVPAD
jgi:hypothetical protein